MILVSRHSVSRNKSPPGSGGVWPWESARARGGQLGGPSPIVRPCEINPLHRATGGLFPSGILSPRPLSGGAANFGTCLRSRGEVVRGAGLRARASAAGARGGLVLELEAELDAATVSWPRRIHCSTRCCSAGHGCRRRLPAAPETAARRTSAPEAARQLQKVVDRQIRLQG